MSPYLAVLIHIVTDLGAAPEIAWSLSWETEIIHWKAASQLRK